MTYVDTTYTLDTLTPLPIVRTVVARKLQPGDLLLDEFHCPTVLLGERIPMAPKTATVCFEGIDLDNGNRPVEVFMHVNRNAYIATGPIARRVRQIIDGE